MNCKIMLRLAAAVLALGALSPAVTLKGTVKNGTTGKPAAGDDVVLLDMSSGMNEQARAKADAQGHFSFTYDETGPHMVRALHQGVNYFSEGGIITPGTTSAEITVYDAAQKVEGIGLTVDMMRVQTDGDKLDVTELWVVRNGSNPPRTQMSDHAFEVYMPEGAQVDSSAASGPGGRPINSAPVPQSEKGKYAYVFPLRPGETRFQVSYHVPYSGKMKLGPKPQYPADHVVVMVPTSMQFNSGGAAFQAMSGGQPGANVQVITNVNPGQDLSFNISGTGTIPESQQASGGGGGGGGQGGGGQSGGGMSQRGRPGGGLGAPEETPDPLHKYRAYILGALAVVLGLGVFYVVTRPQQPAPAPAANARPAQRPVPEPAKRAAAAPERTVVVEPPPARLEALRAQPAAPTNSSDRLLDALKDELFQLELERHQGRISAEEYAQAKAALDTTIGRAARRASS